MHIVIRLINDCLQNDKGHFRLGRVCCLNTRSVVDIDELHLTFIACIIDDIDGKQIQQE